MSTESKERAFIIADIDMQKQVDCLSNILFNMHANEIKENGGGICFLDKEQVEIVASVIKLLQTMIDRKITVAESFVQE